MDPKTAAALTMLTLAGCGTPCTQAALGPGQPWHLAYNGYGHVSASTCHGPLRLILQPAKPVSAKDTHAALVLSRASWRDFTAEIRVRTNFQLRHPHPNPWETGWILWHYQSEQHFYYIALKSNGWELGKADPRYPGNQHFLITAAHPVFPARRWYLVRIQQRGDAISITVNGHRLAGFTDYRHPYRTGRIGLYVEDASATFQPVTVHPAP